MATAPVLGQAFGWEVRDGRREPVPLVNYADFLQTDGTIREDMLPDSWHVWKALTRDVRWQRREIELCRRDPWRFLTTWIWTFDQQDPDNPIKRYPEWAFGYEIVRAWVEGGDLLLEKPRAMLTTITFSELLLHGINCTVGSDAFTASAMSFLKERVDDGGEVSTYDSIFGKARFAWMLLPSWLQAPLHFRKWRIEHKRNRKCFLTAETAGLKTGRGLQRTRFFLDEIGFVGPQSEAMLAAAEYSCPNGKILNGTPKGRNNAQFRIRDDVKNGRNTKVKILELRWYHHPDRRRCVSCGSTKIDRTGATWHLPRAEIDLEPVNLLRRSIALAVLREPPAECQLEDGLHWDTENRRWSAPWFVHARASMTQSLAAQELEVSYEEAVEGRVYSIFRRRVFLTARSTFKPWESQLWAWDFGIDDFLSIVCGQHKGYGGHAWGEVYDRFEDNNLPVEHYCRWYAWVTGQYHGQVYVDEETRLPYVNDEEALLSASEVRAFRKDWGRPGRYGGVQIGHVGDPSGIGRESDLESWISRFAMGTTFQDREGTEHTVGHIYIRQARRFGVAEGIQSVQWALEHGRLRGLEGQVEPLCACFEEYHRPVDAAGRVVPGRPPVHDWTSHAMDAARYWALEVYGLQGGFVATGR